MTTTTMARRANAVPEDPRQHARDIAEAVDLAWHSRYGGSRIEVPMSVVAALALVAREAEDVDQLAALGETIERLDHEGFGLLIQRLWCEFAMLRPDLNPRTKHLWSWTDEDQDETVLRAVQAVGQAALRKGVFGRCGPDGWGETDLLGMLLQTMKSHGGRKGIGQFLTPESVTLLLGRMAAPAEGARILEPCAGTGTMLLGAAQAMREDGLDPTTCEWWANDIDPLAAALCAVNLHLWGLGLRVVVGCGDGLLDVWMREALEHRQIAIDEMQRAWRQVRQIAAVRQLLELPTPEGALERHMRKAKPKPPPPPPPAPPASSTFDAEAVFRQGRLF
ncbi:N-6 DNA Methylase [Micromonospora echinofusca]|uniref:site-specific DNA-methyltransferase (adenine-specific) n=1 Tax=Micromonospora echinofusca TaxID=47858 RepID=A0A1C5G708_MICEH|nr:N-6 DNA methylase [Micromonospora echinofusca]SCG15520.1 N-6 DNA Methylase [Micromonospora echinofusca]